MTGNAAVLASPPRVSRVFEANRILISIPDQMIRFINRWAPKLPVLKDAELSSNGAFTLARGRLLAALERD
jgi:hypothetical protein